MGPSIRTRALAFLLLSPFIAWLIHLANVASLRRITQSTQTFVDHERHLKQVSYPHVLIGTIVMFGLFFLVVELLAWLLGRIASSLLGPKPSNPIGLG